MPKLTAVIGGSGCYELPFMDAPESLAISTPFGEASGIVKGQFAGGELVFIPRHGASHHIPPHKINYRANIWALRELNVSAILALNAVGGIAAECAPASIVVPDQIIDYTYGREHTFADVLNDDINHVDFSYPFDEALRGRILSCLAKTDIRWVGEGVYACMQGPRLETAAEVKKLARDGCTIVGMTAMPEAALARELGIVYASLCTVVNWAAGVQSEPISMTEIQAVLTHSNNQLLMLLQALLPSLD